MWLYINLGFAIIWDSIGFLLFIIGLIPAIQAFAVAASPVIDVLAFLTDLIFCILYQGYVKIYNANFKLYQIKRIREMMRLSKNSGAAGKNPIAQNLARQTQKINQYMLDKFSNYVINFTVKKIQYSIFTSAVELVPWLGDFSPSWIIKANLHIKEHRRTANELKLRTKEFEESLAKWRGHLRIGGMGKFKSRNNRNGVYTRQSTPNNVKKINRERLAGGRAQSVIKQKDINQGVRDSAANNIRPFRKKLPGELAQSSQIQKENKFAGIKSAVNNAASMSGQFIRSIPQSSESEDEELRYRKSTSNNIRSNNSKETTFGGQYAPSQDNNGELNRERLAGERAQSVIEQKDINQGVRDSAANNIRPFRKKLPGDLRQSSQIQKENKFAGIKSVVSNAAYASGQLINSIPQSLESENEELRYRKSATNNIQPFKKKVLSDITNPATQSPKDNNISNNDQPNTISAENDIKKFTRNKQNQENLDKILIKK
jgi:hypothetical protein